MPARSSPAARAAPATRWRHCAAPVSSSPSRPPQSARQCGTCSRVSGWWVAVRANCAHIKVARTSHNSSPPRKRGSSPRHVPMPMDARFGGGDVEVWVMGEIDHTTFLTGANAGFIAELYSRFLEDPRSVDESWRRFFSEMSDDVSAVLTEVRGPSWGKREPSIVGNGTAGAREADEAALRRATSASIRALQLIRAYRVRGHLEADLDPLGLEKRGPYPELDFRSYGFGDSDLDREIFIANLFGRERASLREIIAILRETYCGRIGVEYMHIQVPAERAWIRKKFEKRQSRPVLSAGVKKEILRTLTQAETV